MSFSRLMIFVLTGILLFSCGGSDWWGNWHEDDFPISSRAVFEDIPLPEENGTKAEEAYTVLVITDTHFDSGREASQAFLQAISGMDKGKIGFCAVLGDLTDNGLHSEFSSYIDFREKLEAMGIPVYSIPGNHDTYDAGNNGRNYMNHVFHTTFYRIKLEGTSFYFTDTADSTLGERQLQELADRMGGDPNTKVVFSHYPVLSDVESDDIPSAMERARLLALYANNNVVFEFAGHTHAYGEQDFGRFRTVTLEDFKERRKYALLTVSKNTGISFSYHGF